MQVLVLRPDGRGGADDVPVRTGDPAPDRAQRRLLLAHQLPVLRERRHRLTGVVLGQHRCHQRMVLGEISLGDGHAVERADLDRHRHQRSAFPAGY